MALTKLKKAKYSILKFWNATAAKIIKIDLYGVQVLGIQFTPKKTAEALMNGGDFSPAQREYYNIKLVRNSFYVFLPKL